jgi:hypothetical protein
LAGSEGDKDLISKVRKLGKLYQRKNGLHITSKTSFSFFYKKTNKI